MDLSLQMNGKEIVSDMVSRLSAFSRSSFAGSEDEFNDDVAGLVQESQLHDMIANESWYQTPLVVVVIGASGDLAKKKTYPALLELFENDLLPRQTVIWGYARSPKTHEGLRKHLHPYLLAQCKSCSKTVEEFLRMCYYHNGKSYGDGEAYGELMKTMTKDHKDRGIATPNILYYLAIPPNVFGETVNTLQGVPDAVNMETTKFIIEKPFGRDLDSCKDLLQQFSTLPEHMIYRIDHYLGKPMVDNIVSLRMANPFLENMWSSKFVDSVHITFKEPFGTLGRGGYFDHYGIIRDIIQNHLLQVLLLVAMELPTPDALYGDNSGDSVRQGKVQVLKHMKPIQVEDTLLGQYDGYTDDATIKDKTTVCPTYAMCHFNIDTPRWKGTPFIMEAGKALDDRIVDVKIQFKSMHKMFPNNTLAIRVQPDPCVSFTTNMKPLGLINDAKVGAPTFLTANMMTNYPPKEQSSQTPGGIVGKNTKKAANISAGPVIENAYTRLLMDALRGKQTNFCRDDELVHSWELFTPLLHQIENERIQPESYKEGSTGPDKRAEFLNKVGVVENKPQSSL